MNIPRVKSGDRFVFTAATHNLIADVVDIVLDGKNNIKAGLPGQKLSASLVLVNNMTGSDLQAYSPAVITGPATKTVTDLESAVDWRNASPVFNIATLSSANEQLPLIVTQEKINAGTVGLAMIQGVTPVKISIKSANDRYAKISGSELSSTSKPDICRILSQVKTENTHAIVQLGSSSSTSGSKPIRITGGDSTGRYPCEIYGNGKGQAATGSGMFEIVDGLFYDTIPAGTWTIGDDALVTVTGGADE